MPCLASPGKPEDPRHLLDEVAREARRGTELVRQLVDLLAREAPSHDSRALGEVLAGIDAIAWRARLLSLEARVAGHLHGDATLCMAADETAILADRCGQALRVLGLLKRSVEHFEALRDVKLARGDTLIAPAAGVPTS